MLGQLPTYHLSELAVSFAELRELRMAKLLILAEEGQFGQKQLSVRQHCRPAIRPTSSDKWLVFLVYGVDVITGVVLSQLLC